MSKPMSKEREAFWIKYMDEYEAGLSNWIKDLLKPERPDDV